MRRRFSMVLAIALLCLAPTASFGDLAPYSQDFEGLVQADPGALANDPAPFPNGWLVFGNVFNADWSYAYGYGVFPAPNGGPGFSAIASGQGGLPQGAQQLVVYSDYNNQDHGNGRFIEANVFQEQVVGAADIGSTWFFEFDAKRGDIAGITTAKAFVKTLDPGAGFALTNFITVDMTGIPTSWDTYLLQIFIDPSLEGQILQFGFLSLATAYEPSGILYDNVNFGKVDPRGAGFWKHQCSDLGFQQVSSQELDDLFADVAFNSDAFTECAPIGCSVLDSRQNQMRPKAERQTLALWLNVASGRLPLGTPIDLPALTGATTVGEAITEIEAILCDPGAARSDLETAKDLAEALNLGDEDMELASESSSLTAAPGQRVAISLGLINMSPASESYSVTTSSAWPVSVSQELISSLGGGQLAVLTVYVDVPSNAYDGLRSQLQVTAQDLFSEIGLQREVIIDLEVESGGGSTSTSPLRPRIRPLKD